MKVNYILRGIRESLVFVSISLLVLFSISNASAQEEEAGEAPTEEATADAAGGNAELEATGKAIFEGNCTSCHTLGSDEAYPNLIGITKRRKAEWLKKWIANPQKTFDSGDPDAVSLVKKWKAKAGMMSNFDFLSDDDLNALIAYLGVAKVEAKAEVASPVAGEGGTVQTDDSAVNVALAIILVILALIILALIVISAVLNKQIKDKDGKGELENADKEYFEQTHSVIKTVKHPAFIGITLTILLACGGWYFLQDVIFGIGVQTGYHPTQPIEYSHKLHAGELEIDCNYCHTGVRKAKHANIPSASICMNCHTYVKTDHPGLAALYKSMDFDFETKEFGPNQTPIEWVRVHNLPDHVYFNHSQHVKVGGLECEECHGDVRNEMKTVWQHSTLTMGWCVDCHKNKALNTDGNAYYDKLVELHNEKGEGDFTVEKNGGLECARCHY